MTFPHHINAWVQLVCSFPEDYSTLCILQSPVDLCVGLRSGGVFTFHFGMSVGVVQHQMISPENIQTSKTIQTEQIIIGNMNVCTHTYMHVTTMRKIKKKMNWEKNQGV